MKIVDIFSNQNLVRASAMASIGRRFTSDCNAIGGATLEEQIMLNFNKSGQKTHKLLNFPTIELAISQNKWKFNFGSFAKDLADLKKKSKLDYGYLSAADFFLFKVDKQTLSLIDGASLKTSIPSDPSKPQQSPCFIHNDSSGIIYDWITSGAKNKNIGNVIMMVLRGGSCRTFHFDGNLDNLMKNKFVFKENKHSDFTYGYHTSKKSKLKSGLLITNRHADTGNKPTSFRRGIKVTCSQKYSQGFFDVFDHYVKGEVMEELCTFTVGMASVKQNMLKSLGI